MRLHEIETKTGSRSITIDEVKDYDIALALKKARSDFTIYRGIKSMEDVLYVDPTINQRKSANTENYYNMIISHADNWKMYPRRDRSLICTNNVTYASGYGTRYVVLPIGNPVIGVCPSSDLWDSFNNAGIVNLPKINMFISSLYYELVMKNDSLPEDLSSTPEMFFEQLALITEWIREIDDPNKYAPMSISPNLFKRVWTTINKNNMTFAESIADVLDPARNKFELTTLSSSSFLEGSREIWLSAPSIMMRAELFRDMVQRM